MGYSSFNGRKERSIADDQSTFGRIRSVKKTVGSEIRQTITSIGQLEDDLMEKIMLEWDVVEIVDEERLTAMYCFKSCRVNDN